MDNMCDPDSWSKPTTSSQYIIHRILGLHPKYHAPIKFYEDLPEILYELLQTNFFSAISTGIEKHNDSINCILKLYNNNKTNLPLYIHSRNDIETIKLLNQKQLASLPIIWQNMNLGLADRLENNIDSNNTSLQKFFETTENHFLCLNPLINSNPFHKLKQIIKPELIERVLPTTDSPHNAFTQKGKTKAMFNQPIQIIRTIIQMHYQFTNLNNYKNYHLYDTNEWFFNRAVNLFPTQTNQPSAQYRIKAKSITKTFLEKWSPLLKYDRIANSNNNTTKNSKPIVTDTYMKTDNHEHKKQNLKQQIIKNKSTTENSSQTETFLSNCPSCSKKPVITNKHVQTETITYPIYTGNQLESKSDTQGQTQIKATTPVILQLNDTILTTHHNSNQIMLLSTQDIDEEALNMLLSPPPSSTQSNTQQENLTSSKKRPFSTSNYNTNNSASKTKKRKSDPQNITTSYQPTIHQAINARQSLDDKINIINKQNTNNTDEFHITEGFFDENQY